MTVQGPVKEQQPDGMSHRGGHKASVSDCLPLAAPISLSPLLILTLCGPERVLVVSTEPPDDLSCLTTPGVGRPGDGVVARAIDQMHPDTASESMRGFADSSTDLCALGCTGCTGGVQSGWRAVRDRRKRLGRGPGPSPRGRGAASPLEAGVLVGRRQCVPGSGGGAMGAVP